MKYIHLAGLFLVLATAQAQASTGPDPADLLTQMDLVLRGKSHEMKVRMDVKTPKWTRQYQLSVWMKGIDYSFARVTDPAKTAGQGFLRDKGRLWQYMPSAERTILIPPSLMLDDFMGSDFSNDDFVKMSYLPRDYSAKIIAETRMDDMDVYHLELTPKPDAPVTYSKLEIWLRKSDAAPVEWKFYSEKKEHIRTLHYSDFKDFNGKVVPAIWHMTDHKKTGHETTVTILEARYDVEVSDSIFSRQNLEKYP